MTRYVPIASLFAFTFCGAAAMAEEPLPPLACEGNDPDWQLSLNSDTAQFVFRDTIQMTIPQRTQPETAPFPKALTLLGPRETAIVLLNKRLCDTDHVTAFPFEANILTQKGETPVILRGCCTIAE